MPSAAPLLLPDVDRDVLRSWKRSPSLPAGLVLRARIVLAAAAGESNTAIAERLGVARQTVVSWRGRYVAEGLGGLEDRRRPGRPRVLDPLEVVVRTMEGPPRRLGVTHWSSRLLAAELGISNVAVANIWREHRLQPWRGVGAVLDTSLDYAAVDMRCCQAVRASRGGR